MEQDINQRVLRLKDVALGSTRNVTVNSALATASYDCAVDSLLALYAECSQSSLAKDKHVGRFLSKYGGTVKALHELRLTPNDFEVKAVIGKGHFGEVQVVHEKSTGDVYAMKVMSKAHILQQADAAFFSEERDIMAWATSPWLTSLHYAFQDKDSLYLVMDFHPGGDLLTIMEQHEGGMGEDEARFYLAEIASGLRDLHTLGFVHRDVKPENVLITRSGHIKLVDFGSAARLGPSGKVVESRLPVGTPEYIAPEVLTSLDCSADYGVCCDWWSLGIIAYELLYDTTPFEGDSTAKTYGNIMNYKKSLQFPEDLEASERAKDLIKRLLTEASLRMEFKDITEHAFFSSTKWDNLIDTIPPYIPTVEGPDDTSNFEQFERKKDDHYFLPPSKSQGAFSGKSLPFVGFTFTRFDQSSSNHLESTDSRLWPTSQPDASADPTVKELRRSLEQTRSDLEDVQNRKASLERECVIYQSQLNDFHRKLEIEKNENRLSDSKALQLLEEVRQQSQVAHQLREAEAKTTAEELSVVVKQLEQDRMVASKRCKRLQEELKKIQQERDAAVKKAADVRTRMVDSKRASRKDISSLQDKLTKVTKDSLAKVAELQDRLTGVHEKHLKASQQLKEVEDERRRSLCAEEQAKLRDSVNSRDANSRLKSQLEEAQAARNEALNNVSGLTEQITALREDNGSIKAQHAELMHLVEELESQLDATRKQTLHLQLADAQLKQDLQAARLEADEACRVRDQLQAGSERMKAELQAKTRQVESQDEVVARLSSTHELLQGKIGELERLRTATRSSQVDESLKVLEKKLAEVEREKQDLRGRMSTLQSQLAAGQREQQEALREKEEAVSQSKEAERRWHNEAKSLQVKLSEAKDSAIVQGERLVEVRRAKREIDRENSTLKSSLTKAKAQVTDLQAQVSDLQAKVRQHSDEVSGLTGMKDRLTSLETEINSLMKLNKEMQCEMDTAQKDREDLQAAKKVAETDLRHAREEIEAHELNIALLQRNCKSLEEELVEVKASAEEARAQESQGRTIRETLQGDLETAESRLDDAFATIEKEKTARVAAEEKLAQAVSNLEKAASANSTELLGVQEQLVAQKQLASKYSDRVSELEKEIKLKQLKLKDVKKDLDTEKTLASKLYDDLHSMGREHGKLKAAHLKLLKESEQRETQLAQAAAAQEKALEAQRSAEEAHRLHELRLESAVAQQNKLIDFLQNASPNRKGLKLKKGFKLSRKSRDPAKEMAEWTKMKGLIGGPKGSNGPSGIVAENSTPGVSVHRVSGYSTQSSSSSSMDESSRTARQHQPSESTPVVPSASPTESESQPEFPHVTQYFSLAIVEDESMDRQSLSFSGPSVPDVSSILSTPAAKEGSVKHQKQKSASRQKGQTLPVAGRKRSNAEDAQREVSGVGLGGGTMEHNIPHKFMLKTAPLTKKYSCAACKSTVKHLQKLAKCSHCGIACHPNCIESLPNNCGLPAQLAGHAFSQQPLAKRPRRDGNSSQEEVDAPTKSKRRGKKAAAASPTKIPTAASTPELSVRTTRSKTRVLESPPMAELPQKRGRKEAEGAANGAQENAGKPNKTPPRRVAAVLQPLEEDLVKGIQAVDDVLRSEKVYLPRGDIQSEGWLVLTANSLSLYNRNPAMMLRKPHTVFSFDSAVLVVLDSISGRLLPYASRSKLLPQAFGLLQHSPSGEERTVFIASSLQSKLEWVKALQTTISKFSRRRTPGPQESQSRVLKSVSVVPLPMKSPRNSGGELELSVTSSMMDTSTTSSVI